MATKKWRTLRAKHWLSHTIALPEMHMFVFPQGLRLEVLWAFPPEERKLFVFRIHLLRSREPCKEGNAYSKLLLLGV